MMTNTHKIKITLFLLFLSVQFASAQMNMTLLGTLAYPGQSCAGVWHYANGGREYALVGVSDRLSIVDVSVPANPVELFSVPALNGQNSLWREVKTYGDYAYAVSEGGGGVVCINLSYLPDSIQFNRWYGNNAIAGQLTRAHTVAAADGYLYVFGSQDLPPGGAVIADLTDPMNPVYVGSYSGNYIHDGYIRNDTLWAGEIWAGQFSVIDVSNKTNPTLITTVTTPSQFCHNTWLTDDGTYLFTTDEKQNSPVGVYNVHDINNIELVETYLTDSMPSEEVHNVRVFNNYLINPSYGSQITVCDATYPDNLIEVANYPTGGFLCWDASPYLPSGNIIVTDADGFLYVFEPVLARACYLTGLVTDSVTGNPVPQASIKILNTNVSATGDLDGNYHTGILAGGTYDIEISRGGYVTKVFTNVTLSNGVQTVINAVLSPFTMTASVTNAVNSSPVSGAVLHLSDGTSDLFLTSDANGLFNSSGLTTGTFNAEVAQWGYVSYCDTITIDGFTPVSFQLQPGYYDDFSTNENWTVTSTATTGIWTRVKPLATFYGAEAANPGFDESNDCGMFAFVTGNGGGTATTDDVDNGNTILYSPFMDLTGYSDPSVEYSTWFYIPSNVNPACHDTMFISLSNGLSTVIIDTITSAQPMSQWIRHSKRVTNYLTPTSTMQLIVFIEDKLICTNTLEGGFDEFRVTETVTGLHEMNKNQLHVYPNPFHDKVTIQLPWFDNDKDLTAKVLDISGRQLIETAVTSGKQEIETKNLTPGVYLIQLFDKNKLRGSVRIICSP